jgi:hypothetical protein
MVSNDVRCRCDGIAMLKATSQIRHIAVAMNAQTKTKYRIQQYMALAVEIMDWHMQ